MPQAAPLMLHDGLKKAMLLLSRLGVEASPQVLHERLGATPNEERWAEAVRAHGRPARVVRVEPSTLRDLSLPTVLFQKGGPSCVLRAVRGTRAIIELSSGEQKAVPAADLVDAQTFALELDATVCAGRSLMGRLFALSLRERRALLQLAFVSLLLGGLGLAVPSLTREAMDHALADRAPRLLIALSAAVALAGAQRTLIAFLRDRILTGLVARTGYTVLRDALAHALGLPFITQARRGLGAQLQFLQSTEAACRLVINVGLKPVVDVTLALFMLALIARSSTLLAVALPVWSFVALLVGYLLAQVNAHHRREQLTATGSERGRLHELIAGLATIKAAGAERHAISRWLAPMIDQSVARLRGELVGSWYSSWFSFITRFVRVALFALGARACLAGELSVGSFVALAMLCETYLGAVLSLSGTLLLASTTRTELSEVDAVLAEPSSALLAPRGANHRPMPGEDVVVMSDVWFRYGPDQPWVLKGHNLTLKAGEQLALRSVSGSGKSTILRLIAGLIPPERGTVSVFGCDPVKVRGTLAYLPQHGHLFAGSILHNLKILSGADLESIDRAARATGLMEFIATLPMGIETVLTSGGGNLSGGQRQWILLTAAVASERPVLLLDESLSHLDRLTRKRIRQGATFANKSVIWVSHED